MAGTKLQTKALSNALKDYSLDAIKASLSQSDLSQALIEGILASKGLKDEELEKTTATILNTIETNKNTAAQAGNTASTTGLGLAFKGLAVRIKEATFAAGKFLFTTPAGWAILATTALVGATIAIYNWQKADEEALESSKERLNELSNEYESITSEVDGLEGQISSLNQQISELDPITDESQIQALKDERAELEQEVALLKQRQEYLAQEEGKTAEETLNQKVSSKYTTDGYNELSSTSTGDMAGDVGRTLGYLISNQGFGDQVTEYEELELAMQRVNDLETQRNELKKQQGKLDEKDPNYDKDYNELKTQIENLDTQIIETEKDASTLASSVQSSWAKLPAGELKDSIGGILVEYFELTGAVDAATASFNALGEAQKAVILVNRLQDEQGLTPEQAREVFFNISPEDYDDLFAVDWSNVVKPDSSDYNTTVEYGKAFAEAWLEGLNAGLEEGTEDFADKTGILSFTEQISQVQTLSDGLDQLAKIYKDVQDGADFDYTSILNNEDFTNTFGKYTEEYDNFIQTITNSPNDIKASQDAFNKLASAYIYNQEALKNVTNESKDATVQMLEQMGVSNALEVVEQQLAINNANLADAQENLNELKEEGVDSSIDLADATATELVELIHNAEQLGYNVDALKLYLQHKIQTNQITLSTSGDIQNLANLCSRLGIAGTALEKFAKLKNATLGAPYKDGQSSSKVPTLGVSLNAMNNPNAFMNEVNNSYENSVQGIVDELNDALLDFVSADVKNVGVDFTDKSNNSSSKDSKTTFDWIETKISRIQREITNLGKKVSATYLTWTTRNNALLSELSAVNEEIVTQEQAYKKYLSLANSVGLSEPYKSLVQSGGLRIDTITNETLKEKIELYKDYYEKYLESYDAWQDGIATLAEKTREQFDLAASEYDSYISAVTSKADILNAYIDQVEARGYMVSKSYYEELKKVEQSNISSLQNKYTQLTSILNNAVVNGTIKEGSEEYNNMKTEIDGVQQALIEANTALIEYDNSMRDLDWEVFDKIQDKISGVIEEADFLIDLISDEKMFDSGITEYGQATMGLHAVNYETYMQQADNYGSELLEINKRLAEDPNNWTLIERKEELIELQREAILAAQDEKDAILDLQREAYDELLDSMDEIIQKRKDMMSQIKDMYDYEKTISEQVGEVEKYQKIIDSLQGMKDTEQGKSMLQKYEVSLKEAQDNLEQTEYEKYLSDQEAMLDNMYSETEQWINERMDNQDQILREVMEETNTNIDSIRDTLEKEAGEVGITLSEEMNKIFGEGSSFVSIESTISTTLIDIKTLIQSMVGDSNKVASDNIADINTPSVPSTPATPPSTPSTPGKTDTGDGSSESSKWGSWFIYKKDSYDKSKLKPEVSIIDRLKKWNYDSSMSARKSYYSAMGGSGQYKGSSSQNRWMIEEMKKHGFYKGGTIGSLIKSTGEDGFVLARTGEEILSLDKIKELGFTFEKMKPIVDTMKYLPNLTNNTSNVTNAPNITVDMSGMQVVANDPDQFAKQVAHSMQNYKFVKQIMNDETLGNALGRNTLISRTRR